MITLRPHIPRAWSPVLLAVTCAATLLGSCGTESTPAGDAKPLADGIQVYESNKARLSAASVAPADLKAAADANNAFGLALYKQVQAASPSGNCLFSPYSAEVALAMTAQGAKGETLAQMAKALAFGLPATQMHPAFGALDLALMGRGQGAKGKDGLPFKLSIANSTWGQQGYAFQAAFLDGLKVNYGAALNAVDFIKDAEGARLLINQWVLDATQQKIKELVPKGAIDALTRLVLVNAIYFNAAWAKQFPVANTKPAVFHTAAKDVSVPMMSQTAQLGYATGPDWQAVDLRYDGGEVSMVLLLPAVGKLAQVEAALSAEQLSALFGQFSTTNLLVTMPKWQIDWASPLGQGLQGLGMVDAFDPGKADLSGIGGAKGDLFITAVLQKTFAAVDEKGTEAAAATAVIVGTTSAPPPPIAVTVDRPFLYLIRDVATGAVLFIGRVADPSQSQ